MKKKTIKQTSEYSLTAKQRKEQRQDEVAQEVTPAPLTDDERSAIEAQQTAKKEKAKGFNRLVALILVSVLALGSIITGTVLLVNGLKIDNEKTNPVAIITLENGDKLEMTLYYSKAKAAVSNFIYLASSGFYDGTVFSATSSQNRFLAMAGYTSVNTHRAKEATFVRDHLKGFTAKVGYEWSRADFKLSYRLRKVENTDPGVGNRRGYIAFMGGRDGAYSNSYATSTTFLIMGNDPQQLEAGTSSTDISTFLTYIGKLTDQSMEVVDQIMAITDTVENSDTRWLMANPETNTDIKIKNITFKNRTLNKKLRKNITNNFESFVLTEDVGEGEDLVKGNLASWASSNKTDGYYYGN